MRPLRLLRRACLVCALGLAGCSPEPSPVAPAARPLDVVLIVVDTLRADALRDPDGRYDTPNLDRLAAEGVVFPQAFSAAPMTLPAHTSLFSSRPPFETRVLNNGQEVPSDVPLVADWLARQGYDTRAVLSIGTLGVLGDFRRSPRRGFASCRDGGWFLSPAEHTSELLRASLSERDATKPLFLFAHFADPHEPYDAHGTDELVVRLSLDGTVLAERDVTETGPWNLEVELGPGRSTFLLRPAIDWRRFRVRSFECLEGGVPLVTEWIRGEARTRAAHAEVVVDRGERPRASCTLKLWVSDALKNEERLLRNYALEVACVDRAIGELRAELERLGLFERSLVLFTSDHGEGLGQRGMWGHVEHLLDELIHVPLIVKLPAQDVRRPQLESAARGLVSHLDVVPTLLALAGQPPLPGQRGRVLLEPRESVHLAQTHRPEARRTQVALRDARFNLVFFPDEDRFELYDLVADPGETQDVFAARGRERPDWPERLRWIASQSAGPPATGADDAETEAMLKALGYAGD